jgi:tetratricopeptide (TPR) repeat protein
MKFSIYKVLIISILILSGVNFIQAQKTAIYDQPDSYYQDGISLFNKEQYGPAQIKFVKTISLIEDPFSIMRTNAEYYQALCAIELFNDDAEFLLLKFIGTHPESMHIKHIYFQLGKFQYLKKAYQKALLSFDQVDPLELSKTEQTEFYFQRAYSYFSEDNLPLAKKYLFEVINKEGKYLAPSNYYYAHIAYSEGNYETALKSFDLIKDNEAFAPVIPYYITHIYYLQKNYEKLLQIAPDLLEKSTPKRQPEIARLIGESYYRTDRYEQSIPYLEQYYNSAESAVSASNKYQMAYAYYKTQKYDKAIPYFQTIGEQNSKLGQSANYYLGMCFIQTEKKSFALNAFQKAYSTDSTPEITSDALYNFAKLSYELDYNPYNQALKAFEKYVAEYPKSPHRNEAMTYLTKMYLSTNNYAQALASIEKIDNKSPELTLAYQRILYSRGVQFFTQNEYKSAVEFFNTAIQINKDKGFTAKSLYWKAESYFRLGIFQNSANVYNEFLTSAGAILESNYNEAYYNMAYAYFNLKDYTKANANFRIFVNNESDKQSERVNDAYNRIADSYFIQKEFQLAVDNYTNAIAIGKRDVDYSLFKKAEALSPLGFPDQKIIAFEQLLKEYPQSTYAGNAEYALAQTYFKILSNNEKATFHYQNIIKNYPPQTNFVKKAKLDLGYLYNNTQQTEKSIAILKSVYEDYKGSLESNEALKALQGIYSEQGNVSDFFAWVEKQGVTISTSVQDSANYYVAEADFMNNKFTEAIQSFGRYISSFPTGYFINNAHFYKAESERKTSKYAEALKDFQYLADRPVNTFTEKSLHWICHINYDLFKDYPAARLSFDKLKTISESKENLNLATIGIMRCDWNTNSYDNLLLSSAAVLKLENLDSKIEKEAKLYQARAYIHKGDWTNATPVLEQLRLYKSSIEAAEAMYYLAESAYLKHQYDTAETMAFAVIQQEPSYEFWVVKSFLLSADIFIKTNNLHQAKATLTSIIDNYQGDESLIKAAKDKLAEIETLMNKDNTKSQPAEMIIDYGGKNDQLFENKEIEKLESIEKTEEDL